MASITTSLGIDLLSTEIAPSTETNIGLTFDGKPVFARRFNGISADQTLATNVDTIRPIHAMGYILNGNGGRFPITYSRSGTSTDESIVYIDSANNIIQDIRGQFGGREYDFTIFYIKTGSTATIYDGAPVITSAPALSLLNTDLSPAVKTDTGLTYAGDTLYAKRFTGTTNATDSFIGVDTLTGLTRYVHCEGVCDNSLYNEHTFPMVVKSGSDGSHCIIQINPSNVVLVNHTGSFNSVAYDFTIYWTE